MKGILKYIRPYVPYISATVFIKTIASVTELFIPLLLETIIDNAVPEKDTAAIYFLGAAMLLCALVCLALNFVANRMSAVSAGKITKSLRTDLFAKIGELSAAELDSLTIPSAVSRLTSDTYNINQMLARIQRIGIRGPIMLVGGIIITMSMDIVLSLVLVAMLPIISVVVYAVTKKSVPLYVESQTVLDGMVSTLRENITGVRVIKALAKTEHEKQRFDSVNRRLYDVDRRVGSIMALTNPVSAAVLNIGLTMVVLLGAFRINSGAAEAGVIVAFLNYFTIILNAMLGVTRIFIMWSKGEASAKRVSAVLEMRGGLDVDTTLPQNNSGAHIEFDRVSFSYNKISNNADNISFKLYHGQTLGIIGATGSGKSTVIKLLLRAYDPDSGCVRIDGIDLRSIEPKELKSKFGVVFQNDFIMADSIYENIRYFRDIDEKSIKKAARIACADEYIEAYEDGYEHVLSQSGNDLSGGQRQRLLISRALASDPEILILDDASSALDYATDAKFRKALASEYSSTTSVIVTQRISSIMHADLIIVLDEGKIAGIGTHAELLCSCDIYKEIADIQLSVEGGGECGKS